MKKTAGVVFDFYDDPTGALLKRTFPTPDSLPDLIKEAHILSTEERDVLRNEAFALVMVDEGKMLRKFACVDAGNTALSALYFNESYDRLPEEARAVAAQNISAACEEFGLPVGPLLKTAAAIVRKRDPMKGPIVGDDNDWASRTNLLSMQGGGDAGRVTQAANQIKTAESRQGGVVLTDDKKDNGPSKKNPSIQQVSPVVDVSGKDPRLTVEKKASSLTALDGKYPLDSYSDVKAAVAYFNDLYPEMDPQDRHTYAVKTASRAKELGIQTNELLDRYGSTAYALDVEGHLLARMGAAPEEWKSVYEDMREKRASIDPEVFAQLLSEADKQANLNWDWGGSIADPWYSTFGGDLEKIASSWSWQSRVGDYVTEPQLRELARNGRGLVHKQFTSDLTNAFVSDPLTIFMSLPDDSKTILARLASDLRDGLSTN